MKISIDYDPVETGGVADLQILNRHPRTPGQLDSPDTHRQR